MIAAISLIRRQDSVDAATFRRHWLGVHGPLVCKFAGLRRYTQCHVVDPTPPNATRIDGFPLLFFANEADRQHAHASPEMAACNVDSRQFIGAVSRVMAQPVEMVPRSASAGQTGLIAVYPESTAATAHLLELQSQPGLRGLTRYHVLEQGPAPNSTVPHLKVAVGLMAQAWFDSMIDVRAALATRNTAGASLFVVEEHRLL
ncbi:MAG TPA: EthD family reductase [Acetobacteraceae bacterium]|jgi:uncharacterized protein (TIGR02118 family)|nr:EthD family reductase [Acetobacteraceae bacterium]